MENKTKKQEEWSVRLGTILNDNCIDILDEDGAELKEDLEKFISQLLSERTEEVLKEVQLMVSNIRTFEDKEKGADYFAGWNGAIDLVKSDLKELSKLLELKEEE
jgi:hypothetical protein